MDRDICSDALVAGRVFHVMTSTISPVAWLYVRRVIEDPRQRRSVPASRRRPSPRAIRIRWAIRGLSGIDDTNATLSRMNCPATSRIAAFQYLDQPALGAPTPVLADDLDGHPVAVEQRAHLAGRQVDVVAALVAFDETETVGVRR